MKKYLFNLFVVMLSAVTVSCESDDAVPVNPVRPGFDLLDAQVKANSAIVAAYLDYEGDAPIEAVGFSYQEAAGQGEYRDVICSEWDGSLARVELTGLKPETSYRYYCFATISGERIPSPLSRTFTTLREGEKPQQPKPVFGTPFAEGVTHDGALLNCIYTYLGDESVTEAGFYYKTADATEYVEIISLSSVDSPLSHALTGLEEQTEYVFRAFVIVGDQTYDSSQISFTTLKMGDKPKEPEPHMELPTVVDVTAVSAGLKCTYTYLGDETISEGGFYFKAESEQDYRRVASVSIASPLSRTLVGLQPQTEYTFYAFTVVDGQTFRSDETSFTTAAQEVVKPAFSSLAAQNVAVSSATLTGVLTYTGTQIISNVGFEYKTVAASAYTDATVTASAGSKTVTVSGLTASTAYTFRLYAVIGGERYESASATFTTQSSISPGTTPAHYSGWAELPGETVKSGDYYYAYHITDVNTPAGHKARNYGVCYSNERKCAVWVAAPMHSFYSKKNTDRSDAYKADPDIPVSQPGKWSGYTRGHMLGSAERLVSNTTNRQVFYYSNIAPQLGQPGFNTGDGAWNNLEDWVDTQWEGYRDTVYQVIGCLWEGTVKKVSGTSIPSHYYKVLLRTKKRNTDKWVVNCTRDELQCVAFVVKHEHNKGLEPSRSMMISVADLEKRTGVEFFPNVPNAPKDSYDPAEWGM